MVKKKLMVVIKDVAPILYLCVLFAVYIMYESAVDDSMLLANNTV